MKALLSVFAVGFVGCFLGIEILGSSRGNEVRTGSEFRKTDPDLVRVIKPLPYSEAMKKADFVVIASAFKTEDTKDKPPGKEDYLAGQVTKFKTWLVLKGDKKTTEFTILHFRRRKVNYYITNGPMLAKFKLEKMHRMGNQLVLEGGDLIGDGNKYLLFLTKRKDGRYEALSGYYDPVLSFQELF